MKNKIYHFFFLVTIIVNAQHNYENENTIFSIGSNVGIDTGSIIPTSKLEIKIPYASQYINGVELTSYYDSVKLFSTNLGMRIDSQGTPFFGIKTRLQKYSIAENHPVINEIEALNICLASGNIGIGTPAISDINGTKLTVNGKIHCKEVLVDLNIPPDFVFQKYYTGYSSLNPEYSMPTLDEVEVFTKINNHLPNVPSAKDIQENGFQLKEMTSILLQKIEELTLYTIEQEKRIKVLESKIKNN